ncbi:MAG: methyltransferase type 11 [uncultured bacterium]|uniref:Methyltransferase type 11 n=4 Tax=Candidatus Daviesiibacteriota TaxID=1752718 RepID=A0A0G0F2I3_9BACT|nr:MAG: methyltransferase type 11 [uncultured bacterium]KKQ07795.1 MAG: Methyltransferase type 11 [Candidatus Daviesbacteria bacterium GW2011_GWB1_36_5]KKQ15446.1 MAG: Methyltransferase type 11 [Candidatus Daviesbacteria bacterium GW2011_GWA1_36_8]OGE17460.1 MAG: hypothetical protein A2858_00950 [Candidatus Daviesbacteria bacterium RIFCSPHIGHO2_01_FULL_36_37]OGE36555.1 MAG: hypothetical protein A3E66_02795 [Candidatus Daviesbacteria bacterium RIFCSPHIGHO2_12_FULL_37_16]
MFSSRKKIESNQICLICKSKTYLFAKIKNYEIYKCLICGFGFTTNLKKQTGDYHRDEEYFLEEDLFRNIFLKRVRIISKFVKPPAKILEVGCSNGLMLSLFKEKGYEVVGIEISTKASELAEKKGIKVIRQPFEKIIFEERFDVIIFNHTLEHLSNPLEVLRKAKKVLKPKGILYIDLPNFDSLSAKTLKGRWPLLLPDEHLWHFTEKAFINIFKNLDFKIIYVEKASGIWDLENPLKELFVSFKGMKKRFFKEFITVKSSYIISKMKVGTDLMILARKK